MRKKQYGKAVFCLLTMTILNLALLIPLEVVSNVQAKQALSKEGTEYINRKTIMEQSK